MDSLNKKQRAKIDLKKYKIYITNESGVEGEVKIDNFDHFLELKKSIEHDEQYKVYYMR